MCWPRDPRCMCCCAEDIGHYLVSLASCDGVLIVPREEKNPHGSERGPNVVDYISTEPSTVTRTLPDTHQACAPNKEDRYIAILWLLMHGILLFQSPKTKNNVMTTNDTRGTIKARKGTKHVSYAPPQKTVLRNYKSIGVLELRMIIECSRCILRLLHKLLLFQNLIKIFWFRGFDTLNSIRILS